ncbi:phenylalanyl-tRNA synthetase beta subunit [Natronoarchaeum philippinense]|uniref:Phenylalanine--tRNA ligase beta subunit n=1 Tax=Natronoarchaeum philippinense TaxID=558529 RepID=A0A285P769_NATPI|nr:phenylalanine--tRNA ligase subunit beta [Natronoarchaeum philippinense]SNZ17574.1 phenylalanyl-tRNA synthetase beta subunit [Natronoarchaeum philippinense]
MPTVDVDPEELRDLTGHDDKDDEQLKEDLFGLGLEFEGETDDGDFELEFAPDRLDRLSVEGIARSLRYHYGDDRGVYVPTTNDADWTIEVDESVPEERPYVTGAVIRGVDLDEDALDSLIQLQEKLHATMGRKRAKGAIGIHDLTMLKGGAVEVDDADDDLVDPDAGATAPNKSIRYTGVEPDGDRFVPLDSDAELTPGEVLEEHPTGETYADLVSGYERYPAIYDDIGLFSFPPVINGRRTEVSTDSRDLFVELTGTDQWTIDRMCAIVCYALDARGATIEDVVVEYPDRELHRPDFEVTHKHVAHDRIETLLGVDLDPEEVVDLFERSGLDAGTDENEDGDLVYEVAIPPYRVDVLHPLDLVDDAGRAFGFNELEPKYPDVSTVGGRHERSRLEDAVRTQLVGLGFEDMLNFHMINEAENFDRMGLDPDDGVFGAGQPTTIKNPYSEDYTMLRTWALPSLLMVLERNTHRSYPQDLAEIGLSAHVDESESTSVAEHRTVAAVLARHDASYEDAKARLQALARNFDADLETPPTSHPSFIDGRTAEVVIDGESVGVIGEIHPEVLVEHDLELPVTAFELRLDALQ